VRHSSTIIKSQIISEKGTDLSAKKNQYLFDVDIKANKVEIRKAVEDIFKVKVTAVNTMVTRGKWKRVRSVPGLTSDKKKAIVTLKEGDKIE
jgi:large subunit ribosomal protein L23